MTPAATIVEHDAPTAGQVLVEPANRRRLRDVERAKHDEADGERDPVAAVDERHRRHVAGDLVDHDPAAVVGAPGAVGAAGGPDRDAR